MSEDPRFMTATTIASVPATIIGKFASHPVDTIKAKMQVSRAKLHKVSDIKFGSALRLVANTWKEQGIAGFYRGVTISTFGSIFAYSCYMRVYEETKQLLNQNSFFASHHFCNHFLSGIVAEMASCALWLPIDIIKERMQVQSNLKIYNYSGPTDAAKQIHRSQGLIGLYRAYGATLLFFGPFSAIFFGVYEQLKEWFMKETSILGSIVCSAGASCIAGFITTPLQMVKLRMQIQRADVSLHGGTLQDSIFGYKNVFHGLGQVAKHEGLLALYKGAYMRVLFVVPTVTTTISLTELFRQQLLIREWL